MTPQQLLRSLARLLQLLLLSLALPNAAISQLTSGGCDILDPSINLDSQAALLQQMQNAHQIQAFFTPVSTIEWLGFCLKVFW